MYAIDIFDFENEGQDVHEFAQNWHKNLLC